MSVSIFWGQVWGFVQQAGCIINKAGKFEYSVRFRVLKLSGFRQKKPSDLCGMFWPPNDAHCGPNHVLDII